MAPSPGEPVRRVVLVGMMAAGKSAVGARLARALGWRHLDLDHLIEREAGRSIAEIFASEGEAGFRDREARASRSVAGRSRVGLSPGGGWITRPGALESLGAGTLSVWLRVEPEEVARRASSGVRARPLLAVPDPVAAVRRLLDERAPLYARAELWIDTGGRTPDEIAERVLSEIHARDTGASTDDR